MHTIDHCEVCGSGVLEDALDLGAHALCDDLVRVEEDRRTTDYPIRILFCPSCKTAHQAHQVPKQTLFPTSYHYRARHTADVLNGMRQLVDRCEEVSGRLEGLAVVDIGCNDGSLLSIFAARGCTTVGVEPTDAALDALDCGHDVYKHYFSQQIAAQIIGRHGAPDIVTFTNVFAHIEDLQGVLESLRVLSKPQTLLVIENHYLGSVLDRYQFDTFYHEHPRTYSLSSFKQIAAKLGRMIVSVEFPQRYGGNIRVMMRGETGGAVPEPPAIAAAIGREDRFGARLRDMANRIPHWRTAKRRQLQDLAARHGPLVGKAFPGRAAILVKLLGLDRSILAAVYEKPGSMKIGHFIPGTTIPILSDNEFDQRSNPDSPLLNLAWHIAPEIGGYLKSRGFAGEIVNIFDAEEFEQLSGARVGQSRCDDIA